MPRKASNQWSFGELFAAKELRQVLSVSQLTTQVRQVLENQLGSVWVGGEVTNLRMQSSGHAYFTLKDPSAQLSCVLFRNVTFTGRSLLDNGALVVAHGELTVYELRGQYQLVVRELEFQGAGALQVAFEKLKRELDANGYFDGGRKRPLPRFPERIGLVTSPTGAAIRDVLHVIRRRQPGLEIILAPCRVQGDGAGAEIAEAIDELNLWSQKRPEGGGLDLILVTRGGGSLEDLWAFNERVVAEAIYRSTLPIVSAVGHEIDFTISDFVADLRAATPSVAAEIITEGVHASRITILDARRSMARASRTRINASLELYQSLRKRLGRCRPIRLLHERMQVVDETRARIGRLARSRFDANWQWNAGTLARLLRIKPLDQVTQWRLAMCEAIDALRRSVSLRGREMRIHMQAVSDRLRLLSPEQTLARGYSITTDATGRVVRGIDQVKTGDLLSTQVTDGLLKSKVTISQACLTH